MNEIGKHTTMLKFMSTTKKLNKFNIHQKLQALKNSEIEHQIEYIYEKSKQRENDEKMMSTKMVLNI
jgi:hypothetical protein